MTYLSPEIRHGNGQDSGLTEIDRDFQTNYDLDHFGPRGHAEMPREGNELLLGMHRQADGAFHFGIHARPGADEVQLCLFDESDPNKPVGHYPLFPHDTPIGVTWSAEVPDAKLGQRYGYRVVGEWNPSEGKLFNRNNLLVDPRAVILDRQYVSHVDGAPTFAGTDLTDEFGNYVAMNPQDSAPFVPKGVVVSSEFDWGTDARPEVQTPIIYEAHVKGTTALRTVINPNERGTYAGFGSEENIAYLLELGVNVVELMPVQAAANEPFLQEKGKTNYWKYNTLGFFAPDTDYAAASEPVAQIDEFKQMVKNLHAAGIRVKLDVVYNHTPEGDNKGPILSFKGLDPGYYLLDNGYHTRYTGCSNTTNASGEPMQDLIIDSMRYWVTEMHVDGFRVDLASSLLRDPFRGGAPNTKSRLLQRLKEDPVFEGITINVEPWDTGAGGYLLGKYPGWAGELNDVFRDGVRDFWRGHGTSGLLAHILSGSGIMRYTETDEQGHPIYDGTGGRSINAVAMHDGMTMRDLTEFGTKHNDANGENNRDGHDDNRSSNHGYEGPTTDPVINAMRLQTTLNLGLSMLVSTGVPMILAGDELGRTQRGNNNAYCQDNGLSYTHYDNLPPELHMRFEFMKKFIEFRKAHPALERKSPFFGTVIARPNLGTELDLDWIDRYGYRMDNTDNGPKWDRIDHRKFLGMYISGQPDPESESAGDDTLLLYANGNHEDVEVTLPVESQYAGDYEIIISTANSADPDGPKPFAHEVFEGNRIEGGAFTLRAMSWAVLHRRSSKTNYPVSENPSKEIQSIQTLLARNDPTKGFRLV